MIPDRVRCFDDLIRWFFKLREDTGLAKKPSTSELLDWLRVLVRAGLDRERSIEEQRPLLRGCLGSLLKMHEDVERVRSRLDDRATPLV